MPWVSPHSAPIHDRVNPLVRYACRSERRRSHFRRARNVRAACYCCFRDCHTLRGYRSSRRPSASPLGAKCDLRSLRSQAFSNHYRLQFNSLCVPERVARCGGAINRRRLAGGLPGPRARAAIGVTLRLVTPRLRHDARVNL